MPSCDQSSRGQSWWHVAQQRAETPAPTPALRDIRRSESCTTKSRKVPAIGTRYGLVDRSACIHHRHAERGPEQHLGSWFLGGITVERGQSLLNSRKTLAEQRQLHP